MYAEIARTAGLIVEGWEAGVGGWGMGVGGWGSGVEDSLNDLFSALMSGISNYLSPTPNPQLIPISRSQKHGAFVRRQSFNVGHRRD